jgi:hypothetical protein
MERRKIGFAIRSSTDERKDFLQQDDFFCRIFSEREQELVF